MRGCLVGEQENVKSFAKKLLDVPNNRLDLSGNLPVIDPILLVDRVYLFLENGIPMKELPLAIYLSLFGVVDSNLMDISAWVEFDTPAWEAIMLVYSGEACFYKSFRDMMALLSISVYETINKYKEELSGIHASDVFIEEYAYLGYEEESHVIENMYEYFSLYEDVVSLYRINIDAIDSYRKFFTRQVEKYPVYVNLEGGKPCGRYHKARVARLQEQLSQFNGGE